MRAAHRDPRKNAAQGRAHCVRLGNVCFNRRRHHRADGQRFHGDSFEMNAALAPARCGNMLGRDLHDYRGMGHGVQPAVNAPDQAYAVELACDTV
jgi:hypothetical protein